MKELKALEILKYNKNIMIKFINSFDDDCKEDDEYISGNKYIEELNEAIKELEELNNRSCEGCKFGKFGVNSIGVEVECSLNWNCSRGHSDKFEAKEE